MVNPHRGEYRVKIEGKDYVLRFSADTICDLEEALGMTLNQISEQMQDPAKLRMSVVRTMFCAGLSDKHAEFDDAARRTLFKALGPVEAVGHVAKAFGLAFGVEEQDGAEGSGANPQQPGAVANGTGPASTASGSA